MLAGDNGLLTKAVKSKDMTDVAEIKERAELAKTSLDIDKYVNGVTVSKDDLAEEIQKEFTGSTLEGDDTVVTADEKYDIMIDDDLNITVIEHVADGTGNIQLSFEEIETESRAVILKVNVGETNVSVSDSEVTDEEKTTWLKTLSTDSLKEVYAQAQFGIGETWAGHFTGAPFNDVRGYYEYGPGTSESYTDEYDWMIKSSSINNDNLNYLYFSTTTITCNGQTMAVTRSGEFVITKNGSYRVIASNSDGETGKNTATITKCFNRNDNKVETYSDIQTSNLTTTIDGYEVTIPAGFAYGTSDNVGKVSTGLVITDKIDKNYNSTGNEFVWIPIDKTNLTVGKTNKKMAEISSGTDYRGVLWDIYLDQPKEVAVTSNGRREPAYLSVYDNTQTAYTINDDLQKEYNQMIASINKYGGFYFARYEMGKGNGNYSKLGATPTSASALDENMWYGLYSKAKSYNKSGVTSQMVWGSQYDAMLNFGLTNDADKSKVRTGTNGNHTGSKLKTGTYKGADSINNIFDIEGNMYEWTQEAVTDSERGARSGYYRASDKGLWPTVTSGQCPCWTYDLGLARYSTRLTLYVN